MKPGLTDLQRSRIVRDYFDLVSQTAEFRYRICWEGARNLFTERGFPPSTVIQITCDQGDDVNGIFAVGDGTLLDCDLRENPHTRQSVAFTNWEVIEASDTDEDDYGLALQILADSRLKHAFDIAVQSFYEFHWRECDRPLP
ncbi:hypothetical protein [Persicirhabdus sediminis]|uniref:Uncharacterized protein n=1 Tax=Persicirhabdus sediminis TaxID=454144 RepID=A0A8J7MBI7_9BACT|nr:hypothetical protein [Persicirhabdus sediminis]MBK1789538.1 hypothetical protein [Persicirhabdus sediminis]